MSCTLFPSNRRKSPFRYSRLSREIDGYFHCISGDGSCSGNALPSDFNLGLHTAYIVWPTTDHTRDIPGRNVSREAILGPLRGVPVRFLSTCHSRDGIIKPEVPSGVLSLRFGIGGQPSLMASADCLFGFLRGNQIGADLACSPLDFWHHDQEPVGALNIQMGVWSWRVGDDYKYVVIARANTHQLTIWHGIEHCSANARTFRERFSVFTHQRQASFAQHFIVDSVRFRH